MRIPDPSSGTMAKFHFWAMVVWVILLVPTMLWWLQSVPWLIFMSWYAIFVGHFGGMDAARAGEKIEQDRT